MKKPNVISISNQKGGVGKSTTAVNLAAALLALSQNQQKNKGKTTLNALLKSQKELKVFTVPVNRLGEFSQEARRYGVLYCTLKEKSASPNALCDLLVKAEDAAKINRIIERMGLNKAAKAVDATADEPGVNQVKKEIENAERLLHQILTVPEKGTPYYRPGGKIVSIRAWLQAQHRVKRIYRIFSTLTLLAATLTVSAFASDPITVVNNISGFIFSLIKAVGIILVGWRVSLSPCAA